MRNKFIFKDSFDFYLQNKVSPKSVQYIWSDRRTDTTSLLRSLRQSHSPQMLLILEYPSFKQNNKTLNSWSRFNQEICETEVKLTTLQYLIHTEYKHLVEMLSSLQLHEEAGEEINESRLVCRTRNTGSADCLCVYQHTNSPQY